MKRLAAVLLALLAAVNAEASVLFIDYTDHPDNASSHLYAERARRRILGAFTQIGCPGGFEVVPYTASKTLWVQNAQNCSPNGRVQSFDAVWLLNWKPGSAIAGLNLDSLTLRAGWPTKPVVFTTIEEVPFGRFLQSAACSTGATSNTGSVVPEPMSFAYYSTKGDQVWRSSTAQKTKCAIASRPPGIFRALIGYGIASSFITASGVQLCSDCDAVTRVSASSAESIAVWARYRSSAETAPLIFADMGVPMNGGVFLAVRAYLDSITGGRAISQPYRTSLLLSSYYRTDATAPSKLNALMGLGPFLPASGTRDMLSQLAYTDSLCALRIDGKPVRGVAYLQTHADTLAALSGVQDSLLVKLARIGWKVGVQDYAGTNLNFASAWFGTPNRGVQSGGATSKLRPNDIWGTSGRARIWGSYASTCADADTVFVPCLLGWSKMRADSISRKLGAAGVSNCWWPPNGDWTPSSLTRTGGALLDSVLYAAYTYGGVRSFVTSPLVLDASPDLYLSPATHPIGWGHAATRLPVRNPTTGAVVGFIRLLATRGTETRNDTSPSAAHDELQEFVQGWIFGPPWYPAADVAIGGVNGNLYRHDFFTPLNVMALPVGMLAGSTDGSVPRAYAYWQAKGLVNIISCAESYAYPGKPAAAIVYPDDLP